MKDWQSILKTEDEDENKEFISILPNFRVIVTIRNKNCILLKSQDDPALYEMYFEKMRRVPSTV